MLTMSDTPNWEPYVQEVSGLIESRETYQRKLGQIASTIQELFGANALVGFADEIENTTGRKVSHKTLRNYAWVWNKVGQLELPEDLTYRALQALASTENPKKWVDTLIEHGLSSAELIRLIRKDKGLDDNKKKTILCPQCGATIEI